MVRQGSTALYELIGPVVTGLGYELVGIEHTRSGRRTVLRVYIDLPGGVTVEDCRRVSDQVSGVLDVADPIPGSYDLEVSSPGLDRPLFRAEHFARFAGRRARLRLARERDGRRQFTGVLRGVEGEEVLLELDGAVLRFGLSEIERARLVPEF